MALAVKVDALLDQCPDLDGQELARRAQVSRTRITQILNLVLLAPDIQEQLLWLPPLASGREAITEKSLRRLSGEPHWERQRERFTELLARRSGAAHSVGAVAQASAVQLPEALKQFTSPKISEPTRLQSTTNVPGRERRLACQSL
jgi:hypothetical protein